MKNPNRFEYTVFIFKQILKNLVSLCQAHCMTGDTGVGKKKNKHLEQKKSSAIQATGIFPKPPHRSSTVSLQGLENSDSTHS